MGLWSAEDDTSLTSSSSTGERDAKRATKSMKEGDETPSPKKKGKQRLMVKVPSSSSSDQFRSSLTLESPLQHFLDARLIMRPNSVLRVSCDDVTSSVLSQLHEKRTGACVVEFEDRLEFLDCSDFNSFLVSALATCDESWAETKALLRKIAKMPVHSFLKSPRTPSLVFESFDCSQPLRELVERLQRRRRVPCFSNGELRAVLTANDILELCGGSVAKASKEILEATTLRSILSKDLGDSELDVTEDATVLELMQKLSGSTDRAVPVLALPDNTPSNSKSGPRIIAQFDLAALWAIFGNGSGQWWESEEVTSNIFLQSCVDFLAIGIAKSDGRVQAPVAKVSLDEKLSKVIGRACTSPFRHVVVYEAVDDRQLRNPCCDISSHEFVFSLWTANILSKLEFDSCKPRPSRFRRYFSSHGNNAFKEESPQTASQDSFRSLVVKFNNLVEVEALVVPVCPEHHSRFIQLRDVLADFQHLKELTQDPVLAAVPCTATCRSCAKILGKVQKRPPTLSHYKSAIQKAPGRSCLRALLGRAKAVTAGTLRLPGVKPRQKPEATRAQSRSFPSMFSFCCTCSPATDRILA